MLGDVEQQGNVQGSEEAGDVKVGEGLKSDSDEAAVTPGDGSGDTWRGHGDGKAELDWQADVLDAEESMLDGRESDDSEETSLACRFL